MNILSVMTILSNFWGRGEGKMLLGFIPYHTIITKHSSSSNFNPVWLIFFALPVIFILVLEGQAYFKYRKGQHSGGVSQGKSDNEIMNITPFMRLKYHFRRPQMETAPNTPTGKNTTNQTFSTEAIEIPDVKFTDVGGIDEIKNEVEVLVDFLKNPDKYKALGCSLPKGVLLSGPPGTGKTLLARAIAGEAEVPFFVKSGSEFVEVYIGVGASRVRSLFNKAKEHAPSICFIDEIDAIGTKRDSDMHSWSTETDNTLNQLLVEMDGFETDSGVIVIGATNRPDKLDDALLRPGRFDQHLVVNLPDLKERIRILSIHMKKVPLARNVKIENLAKQTAGWSGAHLKNLVNEAAIWSARRNLTKVSSTAFAESLHKVMLGPVRNLTLTQKDKELTAYHESGHALMNLLSPGSDPLTTVTIIPRGKALGVTISTPERDRNSYTRVELNSMIDMALGGRVAEELKYGKNVTTGAESDLDKATMIAYRMIFNWGMESLGPVNFAAIHNAFGGGRILSEQTTGAIEQSLQDKLGRHMAYVRKQLLNNMQHLDVLAHALIEKETLSAEEIKDICDITPLEITGGDELI